MPSINWDAIFKNWNAAVKEPNNKLKGKGKQQSRRRFWCIWKLVCMLFAQFRWHYQIRVLNLLQSISLWRWVLLPTWIYWPYFQKEQSPESRAWQGSSTIASNHLQILSKIRLLLQVCNEDVTRLLLKPWLPFCGTTSDSGQRFWPRWGWVNE